MFQILFENVFELDLNIYLQVATNSISELLIVGGLNYSLKTSAFYLYNRLFCSEKDWEMLSGLPAIFLTKRPFGLDLKLFVFMISFAF